MADQLSLRGGTTAEHAVFTGANKEVTVDTTKKTLVVNDGATVGGHPLMRENASNSALALGSAATPSLKFTGDTNTGIYSPGADQVAISTNGTGRLFVDASGNVGVGVASPNFSVSIYGATNSYSQYINALSGSTGSDGFLVGLDEAGSAVLRYRESGSLIFYTSDAERMRLDSSGRLGIGTSTPSALLDVAGATNPAIKITGSSTGSGSITYVTSSNIFNIASNNDSNSTYRPLSLSAFSLSFGTGSGQSITTAVTIDSAQRVGIGTTSPIGILSARAVTNGNLHIRDINTIVGGTGVALDVLDDAYATVKDLAFRGATTSFHRAGSESARIDSSGRLLVGTSTFRQFGNTAYVPQFLIEGLGGGASTVGVVRNSANAGGCSISLAKSRGTSTGGVTAVNVNDELALIDFQGADGTGLVPAARIQAFVDGSPGTNDMPGRLVFSTTADGASSPTERLRITSTGQVRLAGAGITFNGDTATANELDDYEEGTCLPTTGTWTNGGSTYTKIGRMVYVEIRGDVATTPQAIALPFAFGDVCIGGYVLGTTTFNGITNGVNASAAGTTITLPVGFIKGFLSYRAN
jgi:hypothetical protein